MGCCTSSNKVEDDQPIAQDQNNPLENLDVKKTNVIDTNLTSEIQDWKNLIQSLQKNENLKNYALSTQRTTFKSVDDLIHHLSLYECENTIEKAWLIYLWITDNIEYNIEGYLSGNYGNNDAESVLQTGLGVCKGYAGLFERLCQGLGITCKQISGYSKAFSYKIGNKLTKENHAWNAIDLNGKWHYVESTWGAGYVDSSLNKHVKKFEPYWFLTPADIFIYKHYSEDFQLQSKKISLQEFEAMPSFYLSFHLNGLELLSHKSSVIVAKDDTLIMEFSAPKEICLTASLKIDSQKIENTVFLQRDHKDPSKIIVKIILPKINTYYDFTLFAKQITSAQKMYNGAAEFICYKCDVD
jgi:transglutaminase/protease-like cytokinesis protein 3